MSQLRQGMAGLGVMLALGFAGIGQPATAFSFADPLRSPGSTDLYRDRISRIVTGATAAPSFPISWDSNFNGTLNIAGQLTATSAQPLIAQFLLDDDLLFELKTETNGTSAEFQISDSSIREVTANSEIEFKVFSEATSWNGEFDLDIELSVPAGLVFLGENETQINHVGLLFDGAVYEASPAYPETSYLDILTGQQVTVNPDDGVQAGHTLGSFIGLANHYDHIVFESLLPEADSGTDSGTDSKTEAIKNYIDSAQKSEYLSVLLDTKSESASYQKGRNFNGRFTNVGLIERAAEKALIEDGDGFIPSYLEFVDIINPITELFIDDLPWECVAIFPTSSECTGDIENDPHGTSSVKVSTFSPGLMHHIITRNHDLTGSWLHGLFDGVDFMLTDPRGYKIGYVEGERRNDLIAEDALLDIHDNRRQIFVPHRLPGSYILELYGLCNEGGRVVLGSSGEGSLLSGCVELPDLSALPDLSVLPTFLNLPDPNLPAFLVLPEPNLPAFLLPEPNLPDLDSTTSVPEPATAAGLLTLVVLAVGLRGRRRGRARRCRL